MTDMIENSAHRGEVAEARTKKRNAAEKRFRLYGLGAIMLALTALVILMVSLLSQGGTAFYTHEMKMDVVLSADVIDPQGTGDPSVIAGANYNKLAKNSMYALFPDVSGRRDKRKLFGLVSNGAADEMRRIALENVDNIGQELTIDVPVSDDVDMFLKGYIDRDTPQTNRRLNDQQIAWIDSLVESGRIERKFNTRFFTAGDSREPELAGIWGAVVGSFFTMVVTLSLSFPLAVGAAIYLEEFAAKNQFTNLIEVNINNLAAVPSIVYGLLGLAIFLNFMHLPRSAPLVGGLVLALMTMPTIIIAARAALTSVPPSIREAALGIGASPMQAVFHHVFPLAMPGILTGTILGLARALGETAPLLMIGMVAFIVDIPGGIQEPASVLPVQIYLWVDSPERAFVEKTSAAILVLLAFLLLMNGFAIYLRKKFERRW